MKNRLLLLALPALMALSACGGRNSKPADNDSQLDNIVENTTAQEEVFGDAKPAQGPAVRKMDVVDTKPRYKVGYQIHFDEGEVVDDEPDSDDKISIRFIAAIDATYSKMLWHRGFTSPDGTEKLTFSSNSSAPGYPELASTVVYETLANGNEDEMTAGQGAYADYTGFIVYSITDIPYMNYMNYYLGVSLDLIPAAGDTVYTDVYAIKVEKNGSASAHSFTFSHGKTGFFLAGTIKGASGTVDDDGKNRESSVASFTGDFYANDEFLVVQKEDNMFKLWAGSCVTDGNADAANENGLIKVLTAGKYVFRLNSSNGVAHTKYGSGVNWYVRGPAGTGSWDSPDENSIYRLISDPDNNGIILGVSLKVGDFKITHGSDWSDAKGWDNLDSGGANDGTHIKPGASDNNLYCAVAGTYNIYLNSNWRLYITFVS